MSLTEIVRQAQQHHRHSPEHAAEGCHPKVSISEPEVTPTIPRKSPSEPAHSSPRLSVLDSPALRTGPPRSISYNYTLPHSPGSIRNSEVQSHDIPEDVLGEEEGKFPPFRREHSSFRGAFELNSPEQREREREIAEKKGKKRESKLQEDSWNPIKWFHDSPQVEKPGFDFGNAEETAGQDEKKDLRNQTIDEGSPITKQTSSSRGELQRSKSLPDKSTRGPAKWGLLRSLLPAISGNQKRSSSGQAVIAAQYVNIADELLIGGLSTLMLRLWFERDEKDRRRVPFLFHRLKIRITDSLHPTHGSKSVFRIECEYANGAARWVIYRQLRDFFSLHTHYKFSNAYNRNQEAIPEFPRTSIPYLKFLKKESHDGEVGQAEFARMQREALEDYLIGLIRAVMFHPNANRLAGFLEISALSISLAQTGGYQAKAGFLRIEATGHKGGGFGRKSAGWADKKLSRWCAVTESYLVVLDEPGEMTVWDVFMLDPDFKIDRPTRYYRQGLNLLHPDTTKIPDVPKTELEKQGAHYEHKNGIINAFGTISSRMSRIFHVGQQHPASANEHVAGPSLARSSSSSSSGSSAPSSTLSRVQTPMLDPSTNTNPLRTQTGGDEEKKKKKRRAGDVSKHTFYIENSQMRLKLYARNERQMLQWITALEKVSAASHYVGRNRFDSFAPIRMNVAAQWLVDGRDYFWNLSRAILLARETIYIHDWWLSPELQLRRPNKDKYRIDRLLERKAKEGVKVYIIVYQEVSSMTTPTDSNYTKQRMTSLHENIMVQRSPSHFQTGTFYWAHHEKLCVIDQTIAFMGGIDLCFGRWDTPQHVIVDDPEVGPEISEIWPGKDYSNPRVSDFFTLDKPYEDMYDRTKIPRMPWHDVGMQVVGQPARDLCRHFVQRWNYLLRIKNHTRTMPFLLPPPEFRPGELTEMGLTGTCEMQICRSAGPWSMGTPARIEHSIQNAYLKAIQLSEHFVYIENQFFITSTIANEVKIENKIGDAIVHRIIRAHQEGTPWKCCIVIPLLPGFTFPVDHGDASAIRIILECQNRTIGRGPNSIFSRIRKEGIDPDDYISIFSLRNWAKMRGDVFTTEQVYIHGKVCIVDDRLAIIGSANINERSLRGDRDSEIAAVIRDTDMIDSTMAGKPFKVGRFAHTLRVRLMREHVGVDVDALSEADFMPSMPTKPEHEQEAWNPDAEQGDSMEGVTSAATSKQRAPVFNMAGDGITQDLYGTGEDAAGSAAKMADLINKGHDTSVGNEVLNEAYTRDGKGVPGLADTMIHTLKEKTVQEHLPEKSDANGCAIKEEDLNNAKATTADDTARTEDGDVFDASADASLNPRADNRPPHNRYGVNDPVEQEQAAAGARNITQKNLGKSPSGAWTLATPTPTVDPNGFEDPISDTFFQKVWVACAIHNTEIYRKVFHAVPDDLVTTWKQYKEFVSYHDRLNKPVIDPGTPQPLAREPSENTDDNTLGKQNPPPSDLLKASVDQSQDATDSRLQGDNSPNTPGAANIAKDTGERKPARGLEPFEKWEKGEMENLLGELRGHLVVYPNKFLDGEDIANNFLFNADRLLPMPIYN